MVTLFRIVEPCGGKVMIDGVDALRLGLQDLREAISIIPQVCVQGFPVFQGAGGVKEAKGSPCFVKIACPLQRLKFF